MVRKILVATVALLLTGALVWARCVDCPWEISQMAEQAGCCQTSGHCPTEPDTNTAKDCPTAEYAYETVSKLDTSASPVMETGRLEAASEPVVTRIASVSPAVFWSPPDLTVLHSALLI